MPIQQLSVRLQGEQVGVLEQTTTGKMQFQYDVAAKQAISVSLPLQENAYGAVACEAFFGGFLPEGDTARKIIGQHYRISPNNSFALLKAIGYDCAGAISFHAMDEPIVPTRFYSLQGRILEDAELFKHIQELPERPLFLGVDGLRLSLAGVQDKAAVCLLENKIALPEKSCPTTHILKPPVKTFQHIVENEFFCLTLAKIVGLNVPAVEIRQAETLSYLLVERYDRHIENNQVERIHQEDFCQALGIISANKYQNEGGPSLQNCFELLLQTTQPAVNINELISAVIFNYFIGNCDAHGKNFSLLYTKTLALAPFYDLVATLAYPELSKKMAMKIGGEYDSTRIFEKNWRKFCEDIQYSYPIFKNTLKKQGELLLTILREKKEFFIESTKSINFIQRIIGLIEKRVRQVL